jgi:2-C-methyl-D-erythritol 4-phosphate cytidylyltransferase
MKAAALLVAAGSGERLGADRPKAFVVLAGRPMLEWSLDAIKAAGIVDVIVAAPAGYDLAAQGVVTVPGGATRSASVRAALAAAPADAEAIVVHDAARPLVEPELFGHALAGLAGADAAIAAAPVTDTIKQAGPDRTVQRTLDRSTLWAIQTPQVFRREALERALDVDDATLARATDDAWLVERAGGRVVVIPSTHRNFKVTTPHDLEVAGRLLSATIPGA